MRIPWTRDEVILALDFLYSINFQNINKNQPSIIELSEYLRKLPIIPSSERESSFRNPVGVSSMLQNFISELNGNIPIYRVGKIFFDVFNYFNTCPAELHRTSQSIRRCVNLSKSIPFGDPVEADGFPEGAILSHFHRNLEAKYNEVCKDTLSECEICGLHPKVVYEVMGQNSILCRHLLTAPMDLDPTTKLTLNDFITVCPNCHRALHLIRPWRDRNNCGNILKV